MFNKPTYHVLFFSCLLACISIQAQDLWLPNIFSDNMVLQRETTAPVWGKAKPGQEVKVEFAGKTKTATAGQNGKWMVKLDPMPASATPAELKVAAGGTTKIIKNVVVGDVWVCSGQSNMEWSVDASEGANKEKPKANYPMIRLINPPHVAKGVPQENVQGTWTVCTPGSIGGFSAVGYYFGKELHNNLKIPIGLIGTNWGGTRIEPWTPPCGFEDIPSLKRIKNDIENANKKYYQETVASIDKLDVWLKEAKAAQATNKTIPMMPDIVPQHQFSSPGAPTSLYNGMIAPYVPYAIKGAIWYQGESNLGDGIRYAEKKQALVQGWRKVWNQGDFPFYFVQIAPYHYGNNDAECVPRLWEGQYKALEIVPNTAMATTVDIGNIKDIHPRNKIDVGKRLSLIALGETYGKDVKYKNPTVKSVTPKGKQLIVKIADAEELKTKDGKAVKDFRIAGKDGKFADAKATVDGNIIALASDAVDKPISVKYAWHKISEPTLANEAGLPLLPFNKVFDPMSGRKNVALNKPYKSNDPNTWGWNPGLTDGVFGSGAGTCFATANQDKFPKSVTIDLQKEYDLSTLIVGKPSIGSTKSVKVSLSEDGKDFREAGSHVFNLGKAEKKTFNLKPARKAKYIKLEFPDHYPETVKFDPKFIFISDVQAYE